MESFDFTFQPSLDRGRIMALAQLDFIARAEVVHFLGPPGPSWSGRMARATAPGSPSGLPLGVVATALGVAAVKAGRRVYRSTLAELIETLGRAEREGRLIETIRFLGRSSLLIVDEIGYLDATRRRQRVTREEIGAALRASGKTDISEIQSVVLETDGSMTVVPRGQDE